VQSLLTLCLLVLLAVAVLLLLALLVCQQGMGLYMLLAVVVPLLLSGCGGHVVHIVPLVVNGRQPVLGGGVHRCLISDGDSRVHVLHVKLHISIFH